MPTDKPFKLSARLPKETRVNGLATIHDQAKRHGSAYVIAYVTAPEVVHRPDGDVQPVLAIHHIEGLPTGDLADAGERLLLQARAERERAAGAAFSREGTILADDDDIDQDAD